MTKTGSETYLLILFIYLGVAYFASWFPYREDEETELYKSGYQTGYSDGLEDQRTHICDKMKLSYAHEALTMENICN